VRVDEKRWTRTSTLTAEVPVLVQNTWSAVVPPFVELAT
jgi:hypothetical protein